MKTDAWGRRLLSTQLASWAELRHDNVLYAKQSFTAAETCEYPTGYVDPYPAFWTAMERVAHAASNALETSGLSIQARAGIADHLDRMAATMVRLGAMAERERANR